MTMTWIVKCMLLNSSGEAVKHSYIVQDININNNVMTLDHFDGRRTTIDLNNVQELHYYMSILQPEL